SGRQSGRRGSFSGPHTGTASQSHPVRGRRTATTRYFHMWNTAKHARRPIPKLPQSGGRRSILPSSAVVAPSRRRFCRAGLPQQIPGGVIAPPGGQAKPARTAPGEVVGGLRPPCPRGVVGSSPFAATPPVAALLVGFNPPARRWSRR